MDDANRSQHTEPEQTCRLCCLMTQQRLHKKGVQVGRQANRLCRGRWTMLENSPCS